MASRLKQFVITHIKPARYDTDGYVIQWYKNCVPSNSLGCLYGLTRDCAERKVLGPDVEITYSGYDEPNTIIPFDKIIAEMKKADGALLCMVGVQSNQFPRTMHIARRFRAAGIPVAIGGFHVSGCLAMLKEIPADIQEAIDLGCIIFAGEAEEGRLGELIKDVWENKAKPIYNFMNALPNLEGEPTPILPDNVLDHVAARYSPFDSGRGCPYQCSFCSIINVQGRKSRWRSPDDIEKLLRENWSRGIKRLLITDDNFARNKDWELVLDRMIKLREEGIKFKFFIQADALCHKTEGFIEKAARAGCNWVYIGLENINPENLIAAKKRQNKIWEYRKMLQIWKKHGVMIYVGYITGFPFDTAESIARDVEIIKRELPVELIEFFYLTPLPGSEDHKRLTEAGTWMDPDMNKYALSHRVTHHTKMSDAEWEGAFEKAWNQYYNRAHIRTILRRIAANGRRPSVFKPVFPLLWFWSTHLIERVHPVEAGYLRRRVRTERRPGMPIENPLVFYPKYWALTAVRQARAGWMLLTLLHMAWSVRREVRREKYFDAAMTPAVDDREAFDALEMISTHGASANRLQRAHIDMHDGVSREPEPLQAAE